MHFYRPADVRVRPTAANSLPVQSLSATMKNLRESNNCEWGNDRGKIVIDDSRRGREDVSIHWDDILFTIWEKEDRKDDLNFDWQYRITNFEMLSRDS